jgi:hypothetical protein
MHLFSKIIHLSIALFFLLFAQVFAKPEVLVLNKNSRLYSRVYSIDFNDLLKTAIKNEKTFTLTEENEISGINPTEMAITSNGEKVIFIEQIKDSYSRQVVIRDMKTKTNGDPIKVEGYPDLIHITPQNTYALLVNYDNYNGVITFVNIKDNKSIGKPIILEDKRPKIEITHDGKYAFVPSNFKYDIFNIKNQEKMGSLDYQSIHMVPHSKNAVGVKGYKIYKLNIEDIKNIKVMGKPIEDVERIEILPNGEQALVDFKRYYSKWCLDVFDIVNWKRIKKIYKGDCLRGFAHQGKLGFIEDMKDLTVVDFEKQEVLKKMKFSGFPSVDYTSVEKYEKMIDGTSDGHFALLKLVGHRLAVFDIKKQKFVGSPIKFINSEEEPLYYFQFIIVPEDKKEREDFFKFENFDLNINFLN